MRADDSRFVSGEPVSYQVGKSNSPEMLREVESLGPLHEEIAEALRASTMTTVWGRLFGQPGHDIGAVRKAYGTVPVAGFFAAGEFGPVGQRNFLHGFTASMLVVRRGREQE